MSDIAAIILAAGRSTRFNAGDADATKLVALWRGEPMVRCVARNTLASGAAPVIVVTGHAHRVIQQALGRLALRIVHNDAFRNGLSSSLRVGIAALPPNVDGALAMLSDMPLVSAQTLRRLMEAHKAAPPNCRALIPLYSGKRGNPALLAPGIFLDIAHLCGDEGARSLLRATADVVCVNVDDPAYCLTEDCSQRHRRCRYQFISCRHADPRHTSPRQQPCAGSISGEATAQRLATFLMRQCAPACWSI